MNTRVISPAMMPRKLAIVITATSRWATWESSWESTASTSGSFNRRRSPVVTQTTACFWSRPVAKAFGMSVWASATRGFGRFAIATSRSMTAWSWGCCWAVTILPPIEYRAILSE